jgi:hypothetical protein
LLARVERMQDVSTREILDEADALFWRAGALSQELHERFAGAPLAPGARMEPVEGVEVVEHRLPEPEARFGTEL